MSGDEKGRDRTTAAILEAIIDSMPDGVYVCDETGLTRTNLAGARLLGFDSPEEALRSIAELSALIETRYVDTHEKIAAEEEVIVLALRGAPIERDVLYRNIKTGQEVYVRCHAAPIFHEGRIIGAVAVNTDITERKRVEDALEQALYDRDQIIGILGHDLRNPLASITIGSNLLLKMRSVPESVHQTALRIHGAAERMGTMIRDLLDFSQARFRRGLPIKPASTNLHDLCRRAIEELEVAHPEHAIELRLEGDGHGPWDGDRLLQVVSNLVGNALRYGDPAHPVRVDVTDAGTEIILRVHNQGVPIRPEALSTLFEPFRRGADATGTAARQEGLGLGLYIVRAIVLAHGGTVDVASSAAAGTTFTVHLPRSRA